jgi:hypothetical protein
MPTRFSLILATSLLCVTALAQQTQRQPERTQLNDPLAGSFRDANSTAADQTDLAVTVYNNDLALVRDRRNIAFFPGEVALTFMDVAQQIRPETVSLRSITTPGAIRILEQNYEYDLMSPEKLMEKYIGKTVRLVNFSNELGFSEVEAELMSVNGGSVFKINGEIYLGHPGNVVLPEIPENLIAKPSLVWLLDNEGTDQEVEVTYLTGGMSWKADYVVRYEENSAKADIDAWVTLDNRSGAPYVNAELKLVAGDINRVAEERPEQLRALGYAAARPMAAEMAQETFAEYHLYTLARRTTIKENQSKQVSLFTAEGIGMRKNYEFRGQTHYYAQRIPEFGKEHVSAFLKFDNEEENQLGNPLPAGVMRVYQSDSSGALQFAGEDRIRHTPKDEEVTLRLGNAFDIVGERKQTDYRRISDRVHEAEFEIRIRNHKSEAISVDVVEPMPADWTVQRQTHEHIKKDAYTALFALNIPADGETVLTYRVQVRY